MLLEFLLVFCYIFCFSLKGGSGLDSSMVVAAYLCVYAFFHPSYANKVLNFIGQLYFRKIALWYFAINIWCLLVITANRTYEISYMLTFLHMFFLIVVGCLLYQYIDSRSNVMRIVNYIIIAFVVQTAIEWMAFMSPSFKEIINYTKSETTITIGESYTGVRANGLSGSDFFGLSAAFAVVLLVFQSVKNTILNNNKALKFILFLFILSGTFFAGRTGFMGLIAVLLYLVYGKNKDKRTLKSSEKILFMLIPLCGIITVSYMVYLYNTDENIYNLLNFTFEAFINFSERGAFEMSSVSKLENHYFSMDLMTFFLGDGRYTMPDGAYYGSTDVGYMRVILYMGVIGLIMITFMQIVILRIHRSSESLLAKLLFVLLLILHAKGEVIVWNQIVLGTVMLYCLQNVKNKKQLAASRNVMDRICGTSRSSKNGVADSIFNKR